MNPSIAAGSQKASFKYFALHVHHKLVGLSPTFETATYAYSGVNANLSSISDSIVLDSGPQNRSVFDRQRERDKKIVRAVSTTNY